MKINLLIANALLLFNLSYFSKSTLEYKDNFILTEDIFLLVSLLILTYVNYPNNLLFGTFIMTAVYFLYIFSFYDQHVFKKILVLVSFLITISFSELFTANFMNIFFELVQSQVNTLLYMAALIISNILTFICLKLISKGINKINFYKYPIKIWVSLILPFTTLFFAYSLTNYFETFRNSWSIFFIVCGLIASNILLLYTLNKEFERIKMKNEMEKMQYKYRLLYSQYNANFDFLHDTIRSLTKLDNLIQKNELKEVRKMILDLNKGLIKNFNMMNTNSTILDTVLYLKTSEFNMYNITVKTVFEYYDFSFLSNAEQNYLFSEIVDIAFLSCIDSRVDNPLIIIKSKKINVYLVIECIYSCRRGPLHIFGQLKSFIEKKNGRFTYECNDDNHCKISVFFKLD